MTLPRLVIPPSAGGGYTVGNGVPFRRGAALLLVVIGLAGLIHLQETQQRKGDARARARARAFVAPSPHAVATQHRQCSVERHGLE